jgi:uncharacterized membrane protein
MSPTVFNYAEAGFWVVAGLVLLCRSRRQPSRHRRIALVAAFFLVLFGVSDVIEAQTGAFWRPLWLLGMKVTCVASLLICGLVYRRAKQDATKNGGPE